MCEQTVFVCGAYAAGDRAIFGERVLDLISDHAVTEFVVILCGRQVIIHFAKCICAVEVIRVDNGDRTAGSQLLCTPHCMRGAERLLTALRCGQTVRQIVERLISVVHLHEAARLFADGVLERLVQLGTDDEYHAVKACTVCIVDGIIEQNLSVRTDRVDLLESAVARAHTCRHDHQNRICHSLYPPKEPYLFIQIKHFIHVFHTLKREYSFIIQERIIKHKMFAVQVCFFVEKHENPNGVRVMIAKCRENC